MVKKEKVLNNNDNNISKSAQRRKREREQRYQAILKSAETLFAKDGYNKTSMEQISDLSELSVGAVYFYFKNKEELLVVLLDEIGFQLRNMLGAVFKEKDFSLEGFKSAGNVFFEEFCSKHPEKLVIIFRESVGQSSLVEERRMQIFEKLISDLKEALVRISENLDIKYKSSLSTEIMAVSIMGMFERLAYHYLIWKNCPKDLNKVGKEAVDFIVGGINQLKDIKK